MAKITVNGMTIEATVEELRSMGVRFDETASEAKNPEGIILHEGRSYRKVARKANVGDLVIITKSNCFGRKIGAILKAVRQGGFAPIADDGNSLFSPHTDGDKCEDYRVLESVADEQPPREAENAKWAKIGRKPGEFKEGDIVRVVTGVECGHPLGTIGVVTIADGTESPEVEANGTAFWNTVELVAPVESLFNR